MKKRSKKRHSRRRRAHTKRRIRRSGGRARRSILGRSGFISSPLFMTSAGVAGGLLGAGMIVPRVVSKLPTSMQNTPWTTVITKVVLGLGAGWAVKKFAPAHKVLGMSVAAGFVASGALDGLAIIRAKQLGYAPPAAAGAGLRGYELEDGSRMSGYELGDGTVIDGLGNIVGVSEYYAQPSY